MSSFNIVIQIEAVWELVYIIINLPFLLKSYQTGITNTGGKWLCKKSSANRLVSKDAFLKSVDWSFLFIFSEIVCQFSSLAPQPNGQGVFLAPISTIVHNLMAQSSFTGAAFATWRKVWLRISCLLLPVILQEGNSWEDILHFYSYLKRT